MDRLDFYEIRPAGMNRYLSAYGWHFSKRMAEWAISMMTDRNGKPLKPKTKEELKAQMASANIKLDNLKGYDEVYAYAMLKADFGGGMVTDDSRLLHGVADLINDTDGYDGMLFTRFYADCLAKGEPILWEELL